MTKPTLNHTQIFNNFLSDQEIQLAAPSIYTNKMKHTASEERYVFIPTNEVIKGLKDFGWEVSKASQMKTKLKENSGFQKHFVHLRNPKLFVGVNKNEIEAVPEILLVNSYDARCSFKMFIGMFRVACSNGLIIQSSQLDNMVIPHRGDSVEELPTLVPVIMNNVDKACSMMEKMKRIKLTPAQQRKFAIEACRSRWDYNYQLLETKEILEPAREADESTDLWTVFNRLQEKLIRGGWKGIGGRAVKALKNPDRELMTNRRLFEIAETFMMKH